MAEVFRLPQMGQTMTEATILKWLKQEGDLVHGREDLVEMLTDKINMGVDPQIDGTLLKILVPEGAEVPVGAPIAVIGDPDEDITALLASLNGETSGSAVTPPASEPQPSIGAPFLPSELQPAAETACSTPGEFPSVSPRARFAAESAGLDWKTLQIPGSGFEGMIVERDVLAYLETIESMSPLATPLAAKIAADLGVPLDELRGSGPRGRVTAEDVRRATQRRDVPFIEERYIPLQGMRKVIATRLTGSYQQAVHVPLRVDADMSAAAELRRQLKPVLESQGARLTYTDLVAAAVAQALPAHPLLNATLENDVLHVHPTVNLGIAVALDEGLTVPVVREAHALRLPELSRAIQEAATRARSGQLPPEAYQHGTFTISNLGQFGIDNFDPVINPPQVAILGVGRIQDRMVVVDGQPAVRPMMTLTLCFDHRPLDGAPAARFLAHVKDLLENPARLLL